MNTLSNVISCACLDSDASRFTRAILVIASFVFMADPGLAQGNKIAMDIASHALEFQNIPVVTPLAHLANETTQSRTLDQTVSDATFFRMNAGVVREIRASAPEFLPMEIVVEKQILTFNLKRAHFFSDAFEVFASSDRLSPYLYERGAHYWGIIEGSESSLVAISFLKDEVMGFIQTGKQHYTLGKLENDVQQTHILYETDDLAAKREVNCFTDESLKIGNAPLDIEAHRVLISNCVKMYIEVDRDIYLGKGGVQQAADYVTGAFSQVSLLYAAEDIELVVNEILVWDTTDPYSGPTTSNYLTQFRNYQNGNYNGDLAHLVGYNGGGGIAYLDVLCESYYGVGYSAVNPSYNNVPSYSWTVEVLTHEIGHNLGSPHTHACAWNGNNTALDGCGPTAGYSEGCNAPLPASGTIMSYCHLVGGVGINFNNGFGMQPGNLIRNRVTNASCLDICGPPVLNDAGITEITAPVPYPCESTTVPAITLRNFGANTLTSVDINYTLDNGTPQTYNWTGSLTQNQVTTVLLPVLSYGTGAHSFTVSTSNPNGVADENTTNDETSIGFTYYVGWCVCDPGSTVITPNPLNHSGGGSSIAGVTFAVGSKHPDFTISGLDARQNGSPSGRYTDIVTVTYIDGNGAGQTYGTFSGAQQASVNVSIFGFVNSVSIALSNGQGNGNAVSVSFGSVNYCLPVGEGCPDSDNDNVCDVDDQCMGLDDALIGTPCDDDDACTDNDIYSATCVCAGTPIPGCGEPDCENEVTSNFSPNPLTHSGPGQSTSVVTIPAGNTDVSFTISNLDAKINGNPNSRFIDRVVVAYHNGSGNVIYGTFTGDVQSTVDVNIAGPVTSVTLTLNDGYDGNPPNTLSVSMSPVISCNPNALFEGQSSDLSPSEFSVFPNPTSGECVVNWNHIPETATLRIYNALGVLLGSTDVSGYMATRIDLTDFGVRSSQIVFVALEVNGRDIGVRAVVVGE